MRVQGLACIAGSVLAAWYLLQPPMKDAYKLPPRIQPLRSLVIVDAPLSQWDLRGSFVSEEACQAARKQLQDDAEAAAQAKIEAAGVRPENVKSYLTLEQVLSQLSRCLAADDPALETNGPPRAAFN